MSEENIRPWGQYDVISTGTGYQVKRIVVNPKSRLSYQRHNRRTEYWVVVEGEATVTLNDETFTRSRGEVAIVPVTTKHRVENKTEEPLVFIEVQTGDYFGEDDIERFADDYGRS